MNVIEEVDDLMRCAREMRERGLFHVLYPAETVSLPLPGGRVITLKGDPSSKALGLNLLDGADRIERAAVTYAEGLSARAVSAARGGS